MRCVAPPYTPLCNASHGFNRLLTVTYPVPNPCFHPARAHRTLGGRLLFSCTTARIIEHMYTKPSLHSIPAQPQGRFAFFWVKG